MVDRVGITPSQSVEGSLAAGVVAAKIAWLDEFWSASDASAYGLTRTEFDEILLRASAAQSYGVTTQESAQADVSAQQKAACLRTLKMNDLVLARCCAAGNERAWEHFVAIYHEPLVRAAVAITGSDTLGRDLAGSLYAEIYGMKEVEGQRRCPLDSYRGRGSLMGWLRTTLAQRHVDHFRRSHREQPLDDPEHPFDPPAPARAESAAHLALLGKAVEQSLAQRPAEERFLLAAYFLDGRTLLQIAQVIGVHEATVSRKLRRAADEVRKQILRNLQREGLSRRAAEEALGADPRDVEVNLRKLLQYSLPEPFQEKTVR
ncbi:MAG: RNA polymerase sigma factor [Terracidiphilus sp.]